MTLIVGIICKDAIVLAADSQTTCGGSKVLGTDKISVVEFENGRALVAESGSASLSGSAIERLKIIAAGKKIENESTISNAVEQAVRGVRSSIGALHPENTSPKDWQDYFRDETNYFELMVAFYFKRKPHLYTYNPLWCIPVPATSYFSTSGIASHLANYILKEHTEKGMDSEFASVIAIKIVEDAAEYVEGCGKPARIGLINRGWDTTPNPLSLMVETPFDDFEVPDNFVTILPQEKIERLAKIIASVELKAKSTRNTKIHSALRSRTTKILRRLMSDVTPIKHAKPKKK